MELGWLINFPILEKLHIWFEKIHDFHDLECLHYVYGVTKLGKCIVLSKVDCVWKCIVDNFLHFHLNMKVIG